MTYNSNKSSGRHYSNNHHNMATNHLQSNNGHQLPNNAVAAMLNQASMAAAMLNPYALSGMQHQPPPSHRHHHPAHHQPPTMPPLNYISYFSSTGTSDGLRQYYHAQSLPGHTVCCLVHLFPFYSGVNICQNGA